MDLPSECSYKRLPETTVSGDMEVGSFSSSFGQKQVSQVCMMGLRCPRRRVVLVREVFPPFLLAGLGMVAAGLLLGYVHNWEVFTEANEMLILVPALLGLKGNLEMTLAARLSTHANLGHLDDFASLLPIVASNIAVVQCQAIIVGFLASVVAIAMDLMTSGEWHLGHLLLVATSSASAASAASLLLACTMILIVLLARHKGINPDNVASPIAGMLGDCCTLGLLAIIADAYWITRADWEWVQYAVSACLLLLAVVCAKVALRNEHTASILKEGWTPVIVSMFISSVGGLVLKHAVVYFRQLAAFAPVTNGAGGNLAAVQASRLSTDLHAHGDLGSGKIPARPSKSEEDLTPKGTFGSLFHSPNEHARNARTLIVLVIPGAFCFVFLIVAVRSQGKAIPDPIFLALYIGAALVQVSLLFVAAHWVVNALWRSGINPDNAAIPYVTSLGDFVGTSCLTLAFFLLNLSGRFPWVAATTPAI